MFRCRVFDLNGAIFPRIVILLFLWYRVSEGQFYETTHSGEVLKPLNR